LLTVLKPIQEISAKVHKRVEIDCSHFFVKI
jgi:hypothetical protein